jgi:hypothetical protein
MRCIASWLGNLSGWGPLAGCVGCGIEPMQSGSGPPPAPAGRHGCLPAAHAHPSSCLRIFSFMAALESAGAGAAAVLRRRSPRPAPPVLGTNGRPSSGWNPGRAGAGGCSAACGSSKGCTSLAAGSSASSLRLLLRPAVPAALRAWATSKPRPVNELRNRLDLLVRGGRRRRPVRCNMSTQRCLGASDRATACCTNPEMLTAKPRHR